MLTYIRTSDGAYASEWTNQTNQRANQTSEWTERTEWIWRIVLLDELNRFVNQVISSKSNNRIQIFLNQTNHHIGYSIKQNDVTKPHWIHTAQKRYYEQPITHKPTASDERTSNYGLTEQHQVNFFRIRWTAMCAWTTTDRIGWNKQITLSDSWQILWLTNKSRNTKKSIRFTNLNLIYKRELSDYANRNQRWESQKQTTSDLEGEQRMNGEWHPIYSKRIKSESRLANQTRIGQNIRDKASTEPSDIG